MFHNDKMVNLIGRHNNPKWYNFKLYSRKKEKKEQFFFKKKENNFLYFKFFGFFFPLQHPELPAAPTNNTSTLMFMPRSRNTSAVIQ